MIQMSESIRADAVAESPGVDHNEIRNRAERGGIPRERNPFSGYRLVRHRTQSVGLQRIFCE